MYIMFNFTIPIMQHMQDPYHQAHTNLATPLHTTPHTHSSSIKSFHTIITNTATSTTVPYLYIWNLHNIFEIYTTYLKST